MRSSLQRTSEVPSTGPGSVLTQIDIAAQRSADERRIEEANQVVNNLQRQHCHRHQTDPFNAVHRDCSWCGLRAAPIRHRRHQRTHRNWE